MTELEKFKEDLLDELNRHRLVDHKKMERSVTNTKIKDIETFVFCQARVLLIDSLIGFIRR